MIPRASSCVQWWTPYFPGELLAQIFCELESAGQGPFLARGLLACVVRKRVRLPERGERTALLWVLLLIWVWTLFSKQAQAPPGTACLPSSMKSVEQEWRRIRKVLGRKVLFTGNYMELYGKWCQVLPRGTSARRVHA